MVVTEKRKNHIPVTGLVLSGGGARGYAHLGVLTALNEQGIYPDMISGTSAGAIAGVLYADGYKPDDILTILGKNSRFDFLSLAVPKYGFLRMSGMISLLRETLRAKTFGELRVPFYAAVTNLNKAYAEYFSSGELIPAVIASASIPVLFRPVIINNTYYVDGGVLDNMPICPIEDKCSFLIGSYVNYIGEVNNFSTIVSVAERAFHLSVMKGLAAKIERFNIYIEPRGLNNYNTFDQGKAAELYELGYNAAMEKIQEYYRTAE